MGAITAKTLREQYKKALFIGPGEVARSLDFELIVRNIILWIEQQDGRDRELDDYEKMALFNAEQAEQAEIAEWLTALKTSVSSVSHGGKLIYCDKCPNSFWDGDSPQIIQEHFSGQCVENNSKPIEVIVLSEIEHEILMFMQQNPERAGRITCDGTDKELVEFIADFVVEREKARDAKNG